MHVYLYISTVSKDKKNACRCGFSMHSRHVHAHGMFLTHAERISSRELPTRSQCCATNARILLQKVFDCCDSVANRTCEFILTNIWTRRICGLFANKGCCMHKFLPNVPNLSKYIRTYNSIKSTIRHNYTISSKYPIHISLFIFFCE